MGQHRMGVPEKETDYLRQNLSLDIFVEGGTFRGETAKRMSGLFSHVYTIEKSDHMYAEAQKGLQNYSNITQLKGDTREHLASMPDNAPPPKFATAGISELTEHAWRIRLAPSHG